MRRWHKHQKRLTKPASSIQQRLGKAIHCVFHGPLLAFVGNSQQQNAEHHHPYHFIDYVELVEWTGWQLRDGKHGMVDQKQPPMLAQLGQRWLHGQTACRRSFS